LDKHVPLGEVIYLDRERCIQCARCVRFQDEIVDDPVLQFHNRGRSLEIVTMSEPGFDSYISGNTTDIFPVGALTTADFRFGARPWELTPVATISPHDPAGPNMTLSTRREAIAGGRNVIKRIMPRQNEWVNELWISDRDRFVHHFADAPDRLKTPLVRKNGQLVEASWDEALDLVAGSLQKYKTAVAGLSGDRVSNEDLFLFQKLFRKGLESPNVDLAHRRLAGGDVAAQVGISSGSNLKELGAGDAILVIASDLHEESPVWWVRVKQATERGAKLVVANARPTRLDKFASHAIRYEAGQGVKTAQQLLHLTKVDTGTADQDPLVAAADALISAQNLVIFYGYEGLTFDETDLLAKLLANLLLIKTEEGHAGRMNNGLIPVWPHNNTQGAWDMGVHPTYEPGYKTTANPGLSANAVYDGTTSGAVKALYVMGADPVGDGLLNGRGQLEFLVVQELFLTKTAEIADVVLPAQSWAEREGTFTNGERRVQRYYPALQPIGDNRADWQILAQIGERVGLEKPAFAASLVFNEIAKAVPQYKSMTYRSLGQVVKQWPDVGGEDLYYGGNAYENKQGLGQQWAVTAENGSVAQFDVPTTDAETAVGLKMMRAASLYTPGTLINHSQVLAQRIAQPTITLHTDDAAAEKVAEGDKISVGVNGKTVHVTVHVNGSTPAGLALIQGVSYWPGTAIAEIYKHSSYE
jgi:NADH-quinone oxidoreductase subunit G